MNIVFDLGGVVVKWQPEAIVAAAFPDPAVQARVLDGLVRHPDWLALDRGTLAREDAVSRAAKRTGLSGPALDAFLGQVPRTLVAIPETVDLMYRLKTRGHTLYCLSNMHVESIEYLERAYDFWEVFEGVVVSCRVRLCKPEAAIYAYLLERHGLNGADTVFIDDMAPNLSAAASFGIRTIRFENAAQCEGRLRALDCL